MAEKVVPSHASIFSSLADEHPHQQELSPYLLGRRLAREARPRPWAQPAKTQPADSDIRTGPAMSRPVAPRFSRLEGSSGVPSRLPLRISAPRVAQHGGSQALSQPVLGTQSVALPTLSMSHGPVPARPTPEPATTSAPEIDERTSLRVRGTTTAPLQDVAARPTVVSPPPVGRPNLDDNLQEALINFLAFTSAWDRAHPSQAPAAVEIPTDDNFTSEPFFADAG
ncbi:MAG: hypothetical protein Q9191_008379 [Dirinaria sp. TL-2023a]